MAKRFIGAFLKKLDIGLILDKVSAREKAAVSLLIACFVFQAAAANLIETDTYDERGLHLRSGLHYLQTGVFDENLDNPPLMRVMGAFPLLFMKGLTNETYHTMDKLEFSSKILFWSRLVVILLGAVGGVLLYSWAKEMYGVKAGLLSLFLYSFCPNILANAAIVTVDYGAAFFYMASVYSLYVYLKRPSYGALFLSGLTLGLAQLVKFSAILLYPIFILLYAVVQYGNYVKLKKNARLNFLFGSLTRICAIFLLSVLVLNGGYLFHGTMKVLGGGYGSSLLRWLSGSALLNWIPVPLPENYLRGVDIAQTNMEHGWSAYLMGEYSRGGWWSYFVVAYLLKTPVPSILLFMLALYYSFRNRLNATKELFLLIPIVLVFFHMSFLNKMNIGIRYILPVYPFMFIYSGRVVDIKLSKKQARRMGVILTLLCIWYPLEVLSVWPNHLCYFNQIAGGPENGHNFLIDSNCDWGQDERNVRQYKNASDVPVTVNPACTFVHGRVALNLNLVKEVEYAVKTDCRTWLIANYPPIKKIGYTWWVYDVPPPVDEIKFGFSYRGRYGEHEVKCDTVCDESRTEQIFIKDGQVEFTMNVNPQKRNVLMIDVNDNWNCRLIDIYVNDEPVDYLKGFGFRRAWYTYNVPIPPDKTSSGKVKITLRHNSKECDGWDLSYARIINPLIT